MSKFKTQFGALVGITFALACSADTTSRGSEDIAGEASLQGDGNDFNATISATPQCSSARDSDACKDVVGELIFRGVVLGEGPAAHRMANTRDDSKAIEGLDTSKLAAKLSDLAASRAAYCTEGNGSQCAAQPRHDATATNDSLSTLAGVVSKGAVSRAELESGLSQFLEAPDSLAMAAAMRTVESRAFIDFADSITSGDPLQVGAGLRQVTDVLLTSLLPVAEPDGSVLKATIPRRPIPIDPFPPLDPVVEVEIAVYAVAIIAVAVVVTIVAVIGEDPYSSSFQSNLVVGDLTNSFAGLLP